MLSAMNSTKDRGLQWAVYAGTLAGMYVSLKYKYEIPGIEIKDREVFSAYLEAELKKVKEEHDFV